MECPRDIIELNKWNKLQTLFDFIIPLKAEIFMSEKIVKSYILFVLIVFAIVVEFFCGILIHLQGYFSLMWFLIILIHLFIIIYLYGDINAFNAIYQFYKALKSSPHQKDKIDVLKEITFRQLLILRRHRVIEKGKVRQKLNIDGFSLLTSKYVGLIFYHHKKIHTYAIVILISEKYWIIINGAFENSIFYRSINKQDIISVKQKFSVWVAEQDIRFRPLEFQQQSTLK